MCQYPGGSFLLRNGGCEFAELRETVACGWIPAIRRTEARSAAIARWITLPEADCQSGDGDCGADGHREGRLVATAAKRSGCVRNAARGARVRNREILQITRDAESAAAEYSGTQGDESDAALTEVHRGKPPADSVDPTNADLGERVDRVRVPVPRC